MLFLNDDLDTITTLLITIHTTRPFPDTTSTRAAVKRASWASRLTNLLANPSRTKQVIKVYSRGHIATTGEP